MIEQEFLPPKSNKMLLITMHVFAIASMTAYQIIMVIYFGASVTKKGYLIFLLQIVVYFLNVFWVIPHFYKTRKYVTFFSNLLIIIAGYIFIRGVIIFNWPWLPRFWEQVFSNQELFFASLHLVFVLGTSFFIGFYRQSEIEFLKKETALKANINTMAEMRRIEMTSYQLQLNPHFTFNALNVIKLQSEQQLPNVARAIEKLSKILRYSLIDPLNTRKVDLGNDLAALKDYIELYQYNRPAGCHLIFSEQLSCKSAALELPPGILITLADNVFKYGVTHESEYPAEINISVNGSSLNFSTRNYKMLNPLPGAGLGLKNVRAILEYYYPHNYNLTIDDQEDFFALNLKINL